MIIQFIQTLAPGDPGKPGAPAGPTGPCRQNINLNVRAHVSFFCCCVIKGNHIIEEKMIV